MLSDALRNSGIKLQELYIFFHCGFGDGIKEAVLGDRKITLHQDPERSFESWCLFEKGFLGFGGEGKKLAIFEGFNKDLTRFVLVNAKGNIAHPCIFYPKLQDDFKAIGVYKIFANTTLDDKSFEVAHLALMKHDGFFRDLFIF